MKLNRLLFLLVIIAFFVIGYLHKQIISVSQTRLAHEPCIPTFEDGDGPYYTPDSPFRTKIVPDKNNGKKLIVEGKVLRSDCKQAVTDVFLDLWQADETGAYQKDAYRGKINVGRDGSYLFETVMPKGYSEGTAFRPPHIHFKVWRGTQLIITSEMFFPEVRGKPGFDDAYIMTTEEKHFLWNSYTLGHHDIILP